MKQTKLVSFVEVCANVATGFIIAMLVWIFVIPLFWPRMAGPVEESFWITFIFTVASITRGYVWRRFFNAGFHTTVVNWVGRLWGGNERDCEPYHLAAALGDRPCTYCGHDSWMSKYRKPGGDSGNFGGTHDKE